MRERLAAVDGLRGLAILMVTLHHLGGLWQSDLGAAAPFLRFGRWGVGLFFAVSGFCLYYQVARKWHRGEAAASWRQFAARRATRILPAYSVAVVVWLFIWHGHYQWPLSIGTWEGWQRNLLTHLTFTHTLFPSTFYSLHPVFWSLGTEVHFYLVFPLLAVLCWRWPWVFVAGAFALAGGIWWAGGPYPETLSPPSPFYLEQSVFGRLAEFATGMLVARVVACREGRPLSPRPLAGLWAVGIGGLLAGSLSPWWAGYAALAVAPAWGALILAAVSTPRRNPLLCPVLLWLGVASYSIYLHNYAFYLLPRHLPLPVWFGLSFALVLAVGAIAHYGIERPALEWRSRHRALAMGRPPQFGSENVECRGPA